MNFVLAILFSFCSISVLAAEEKMAQETTFFGHNVSITSYLLPAASCSVGTTILACGLSDHLNVATSPWLWDSYNMSNLFFRLRVGENSHVQDAFQLGYFKTFGESSGLAVAAADKWNHGNYSSVDYLAGKLLNPNYRMEALWAIYVKSWKLDERYIFHLNFGVQHFIRDNMPFSLRRPSLKPTPTVGQISTLHEMNAYKNLWIVGEVGMIGPYDQGVYFHTGSSIQYRRYPWHIHLGYSLTATAQGLTSPTSRFDFQQDIRTEGLGYNDIGTSYKPNDGFSRDFSVHPEFAVQYEF